MTTRFYLTNKSYFDLENSNELKRAQDTVLQLEQLVYEGYNFPCEDLDIFYLNTRCFRKGSNGLGFISGSTYTTDGNMPIFQSALQEMKVKVRL
jgi:hypothetical protein